MKMIRNYVTNMDKNIYVIYNLPPEVIAVLFAYVSRSPASFRDNLKRLIESKDIELTENIAMPDFSNAKEKAKKFHEKWVVGYGHSSVAEHAMASVAIEDVSILASKVIEDNRLASYTEKSTRYQIFDKNRYYKPRKIMDSKHKELYEETCNMLFDTYDKLVKIAIEKVKKKYPNENNYPDKLYESISKARACDIVRYLLPASTLTNLAMTANARVYEHAIRKFLSNELDELNDIGMSMKEEIQKIIPTLVKYANENEYLSKTPEVMRKNIIELVGKEGNAESEDNSVMLVRYDTDAEERILASILYKFSNLSYDEALTKLKAMSPDEKLKVLEMYTKEMGNHDWPMREFEHTYYTMDILCDYGAFRDIQRHRMSTQSTQLFTTYFGYSTPDEILEFGMKEEYDNAMEKAKEAFEKISADFPVEAQYVVPLGYRIRSLFTWNLRELFHFIKLRSGKEGHISYRKIAKQCYDEVKKVHPTLARFLIVHDIDGPSRG